MLFASAPAAYTGVLVTMEHSGSNGAQSQN